MKSRREILRFIILIGDLSLIYLSLLLALAVRYGDFSLWPGPQTRSFVFHFLFLAPAWIFVLYLLDFYKIPPFRDAFDFFYNLVVFILLAGSLSAVYFYARPKAGISPKVILAIHVCLFSLFLVAWRLLLSKALEVLGIREKIVLIGPFSDLSEEEIRKRGFELIKRFDLGSLDVPHLKKWAKKADSIVFEPGFLKEKKLVGEIFENMPLKVNYISYPEFYEDVSGRVPLDKVDEAWFLINLSQSEKKVDQIVKRGFDILLSVFGLLIALPFFPLIALAIKLDSEGPVFYCQKRVGKNRESFMVCKFRTMSHTPDDHEEVWREKKKDQITGVGRFLRRSCLDELPQLWSILKGELSFVGPRPEWVKLARMFEKEIPFYFQRYLIRPGLTGWAQINFPASTSVEEARKKFEYDLYYIKNRSFLLDLGIILKTIRIVFWER